MLGYPLDRSIGLYNYCMFMTSIALHVHKRTYIVRLNISVRKSRPTGQVRCWVLHNNITINGSKCLFDYVVYTRGML